MTKGEESLSIKTMTGISLMGKMYNVLTGTAVQKQDLQLIPMILTGHFDQELKCAAHMMEFGKIPDSKDRLESPQVTVLFDHLKWRVRSFTQGVIDLMAENDRLKKEQARLRLLVELRERDRPHELGTVDQMAERYGVSKSEIRRRKAAGTLYELDEAYYLKRATSTDNQPGA
jgi:hypothetical protein